MVEQNSSTILETVRPVQRKAKQGYRATKAWFSERSTPQLIALILLPILVISAVAGFFLYRKNSATGSRRRTKTAVRSRARTSRVGTLSRRRRVGRRVGGRARGRRMRGRATTTVSQAGAT